MTAAAPPAAPARLDSWLADLVALGIELFVDVFLAPSSDDGEPPRHRRIKAWVLAALVVALAGIAAWAWLRLS